MVKAFWGLCIVMICMTLASISDARFGRRQKSCCGRRARVDPALCTPEVAPYGCLAVPRDCDVIDIQTFRNVINGDVNSVLWRIDAVRFLKDGLLPTYVINIGYEITDRNTTRIGFKYRTENVSGPNCILLQATNDVPEGTLASRDRAIMNFDLVIGPPINATPFRMWYVSDNPEQYFFEFGCIDRNTVRNGVCYGRWYLDIIMSEGKLDNPPMHLIVRELWQKFGLKFDDPRNTFLWIGYECPGDILP